MNPLLFCVSAVRALGLVVMVGGILSACGGGGSSVPNGGKVAGPQFVYVANRGSNNVSAYSIAANGALTPVPGSPFASSGNFPTSVTVNPAGTFAYVSNEGNIIISPKNNVSAYSIGANGALTPVAGSPFAAGGYPTSVSINPAGTFAYVSNSGSNNVSAYSIGANGALTPVPGSPFAAGTGPTSVTVNPAGTFAYVANNGSNNISAYSIGANGALTPVAVSPFVAGNLPTSVVVAQP